MGRGRWRPKEVFPGRSVATDRPLTATEKSGARRLHAAAGTDRMSCAIDLQTRLDDERMSEILSLFQYHRVNPTTWVYLSSLLTIGLFFKFNRFWSIRNLDLLLLMLLGPGLLMANFGLQMRFAASTRIKAEAKAAEEAKEKEESEEDVPISAIGVEARPVDPGATAVEETLPARSAADDGGPADESLSSPETTDDELAAGETSNEATDDEAAEEPTPGEVALRKANGVEKAGYVWLFFVGAILLFRLLADPTMARRPLLEPNLTAGGLAFSCCALFMFLMANVITSTPMAHEDPSKFGPGYRLLYAIPQVPVTRIAQDPSLEKADNEEEESEVAFGVTAKIMAILGHLAIVAGIILTGYRHFDNIRAGIGTATLYLLLPYTAQMTGRVDHVLPAALLLWAVYFYRRPLTAGIFVGLAGVVYYPLFLLPLWLSFYWKRGKMRFISGVSVALGALVLALMVYCYYAEADFGSALVKMFGLHRPVFSGEEVGDLAGFWNHNNPVYRLPLMVAFGVLSLSFALWPAQKNLGTLMCCTAAVMLAAQFWHRYNGGTSMAWYLPLVLLTVFRPNLEDRVALAVLGEGWFPRRRANAGSVGRAA